MSADLTFNEVLTEIIQEIRRFGNKITNEQFDQLLKDSFKNFNPTGPEIMLKTKLFTQLSKAETVKDKLLIVSETWSI